MTRIDGGVGAAVGVGVGWGVGVGSLPKHPTSEAARQRARNEAMAFPDDLCINASLDG